MRLGALVLVLALAACNQQPAEPPPPNPANMSVDITRYGEMLGQVEALTADMPTTSNIAASDPRALARGLREAVWAYNLERSRLCGRGVLPEASCGAPFLPAWINEAPDTELTVDMLAERQGAVSSLVAPFWQAVCASAQARAVEGATAACGGE